MRYCLLTLGCPKNEVDSEAMANLLGKAGYVPVDKPTKADVVIVNTCAFIDVAIEESTQTLRDLAARKRAGQMLVAAGCLAERYAERLRSDVPQIDAVVSTRELERIVEVVKTVGEKGGKGKRVRGFGRRGSASSVMSPKASAYLKIADGCSASCAFCTIPRIKGPYQSKPLLLVVEEARRMVEAGVKEIVLIAQDTTAYGYDWAERDALADLVPAIIAAVPDLKWLRLMYTYPSHLTSRLVDVMARYPQVCHYLDLPLQHAHPAVLRRMRRPSDVQQIRALIRRLREAIPDVSLRTTFIVGFPGETEAEFHSLLEFVEEIAFDRLGVFTYSREEGTPAASLPEQVPAKLMRRRFETAMELQQRISLARNRAQVGRELDVLLEGVASPKGHEDGNAFPMVGRTYRDAPEVDGLVFCQWPTRPQGCPSEKDRPEGRAPRPGDFVRARVIDALEYDLLAEISLPLQWQGRPCIAPRRLKSAGEWVCTAPRRRKSAASSVTEIVEAPPAILDKRRVT